MSIHHHNEISGHMAWTHLEMGLDDHEVISNSTGYSGLHGVREKLEEWAIVVSQLDINL